MPGSWELRQNNQVLCAILHTDNTTVAWSFGLKNLILPGHVVGLSGMPFDMARNVACKQALENKFDFVFFLDSDVVPPRDAILRLMNLYYRLKSQNILAMVSGLYCRRSPPHGIPVMMKPLGHWITQYEKNSLVEVDVAGAGCLLIHRNILEKLPPQRPGKPWFDWRVDMAGLMPQEQCLSEDFTLMMYAKKYGIRTFVDTSIVCKHVGYAEANIGTFQPLEAATVT